MSDLKDEGGDQIAMEIADETIKRAGRKAAVGRVDGGQEQELRGELLKAKAKKLMRLHDDIKAANAAYSAEVKEGNSSGPHPQRYGSRQADFHGGRILR